MDPLEWSIALAPIGIAVFSAMAPNPNDWFDVTEQNVGRVGGFKTPFGVSNQIEGFPVSGFDWKSSLGIKPWGLDPRIDFTKGRFPSEKIGGGNLLEPIGGEGTINFGDLTNLGVGLSGLPNLKPSKLKPSIIKYKPVKGVVTQEQASVNNVLYHSKKKFNKRFF